MTTTGPDHTGDQILASAVASRRSSFDELRDAGSLLYWLESAQPTGIDQVVSWSTAVGCEVFNAAVGSTLHAYGGGIYTVTDRAVWAVDHTDGRVGQLGAPSTRRDPGVNGDLVWAAGYVWVVRESDHHDVLLAIDPVTGSEKVVHEAPFIAEPRAAAGRLAWTQWPAEVMPWDEAEIWTADLGLDVALSNPIRVAGGPGESAVQPSWGPDGQLYFMSDRSNWWNLYRWNRTEAQAVAPLAAECAQAPWEAGYRSYVFLTDGRIALIAQHGPYHRLALASQGAVRWLDTPFTSIKPYLAAYGNQVAVIGSSPTRAQQIALVATDGSGHIEVIRDSVPPAESQGQISQPQVLRVPAPGGEVTAIMYRPTGVGAAPLIVRVHPGPTHHSELRLDWEVQYFTSRGFIVVDVDYRGSTGYGRTFRKALDGAWGDADVEDCTAVARHLLATGSVLTGAVFIAGASAGGYTAVRAVSHDDTPFVLATARSAIVDPVRWQETAPRFQRPHAAILSHRGSAIDPAAVRRPVLLTHGDADPIAPISDVVDLAQKLRQHDRLAGLIELPGVGHGISGVALARTLEAEYGAYMDALKLVR